MKLAHNYDDNGFFTGSSIVKGSLPANSTLERPEGFYRPRFKDGTWVEGDPRGRDAHLAAVQIDKEKISLSKLVVTTSKGITFNACDKSQNRICRAVLRMSPGDMENWRLADGTVSLVSREDLMDALRIAGERYTRAVVGKQC